MSTSQAPSKDSPQKATLEAFSNAFGSAIKNINREKTPSDDSWQDFFSCALFGGEHCTKSKDPEKIPEETSTSTSTSTSGALGAVTSIVGEAFVGAAGKVSATSTTTTTSIPMAVREEITEIIAQNGTLSKATEWAEENNLGTFMREFAVPYARAHTWDWIYGILICTVIVVIYRAVNKSFDIQFREWWQNRHHAGLIQRYRRLWNTEEWWVLALLMDQWFSGLLPGDGPWTSVNAKSLRAKKDKTALKMLVRMGIYPLYILDGGLDTVQEKPWWVGRWGNFTFPRWKQSKKRAVFEFVVPMARGWMRHDKEIDNIPELQRVMEDKKYLELVKLLIKSTELRRASRWRTQASALYVPTPNETAEHNRRHELIRNLKHGPEKVKHVVLGTKVQPDPNLPTENGATSRFYYWLPFKPDRIINGGRALLDLLNPKNYLTRCQLLTTIELPVVRIEAADSEYLELDKEVLLIAQNLGLGQRWDEKFARLDLRKFYLDNNLTPLETT